MTLLKLALLLLLFVALTPLAVSRASASYQENAYVLARGEVNKQGIIPFTEGMTLRHAMVLFDGLTATADRSRVVVLGKDGRRLTVNPALMNGTNEEVELQAGDVIAVPSLGKQHFFAMGEVNAPGIFEFIEGMTLRQAAILFGGTTHKASLARTFIVRKDVLSGRQKVIPLDIGAVMRGENEDLPILVDDVIVIREFGVGSSKP